MILSFISAKNGDIRSNKTIFVEKVQKNFIEKIHQIHFYCIFKPQFFKNFQIFENFRKLPTPENRREQGFHSDGCKLLVNLPTYK